MDLKDQGIMTDGRAPMGPRGVPFLRRVTILAGHFGSGKTEIAVNAALALAGGPDPVSVVDLDVVKPYFRTRSAREFFEEAGVELVSPCGELAASDLPIVLPAVRERLMERGRKVILDAGGDDMGVRALSSVLDAVPPGETDFLCVLNFRRPFTPDAASAVEMARKIESSARLRFTGLISNTHLMRETTPEIVREGYAMALETGSALGLPVVMQAVEQATALGLGASDFQCPLFVLKRVVKPPFEEKPHQRETGPLFKLGG